MNKSESIKELATALSKAQSSVQDARKDKAGQGYKYADLSQILQIIRPVLGQHGLSVVQFPMEAEPGRLAVETVITHESGEFMANSYSMEIEQIISKAGKAVTSKAQASGSIITYMRRYALAAVMGITQEDNDAALQREYAEQNNAQDQAIKQAKEAHDIALRDNLASVNAVKLGIADGDLSTAAEAWQELPEPTQRALWLAPSKGGILTTEERKTIKEKFSSALRGEA